MSTPQAPLSQQLTKLAGVVDGRCVARMLRQLARAVELLETSDAEALDERDVDVPAAEALCRQILSGRIRQVTGRDVHALAGTTLVLAARLSGQEVQA